MTIQSESNRNNRIINIIFWLLIGLLTATILIMYATPTKDGDVFFHLVYGKTIIENQTLTPDHTIYSWTDTKSDYTYCAWLGQIFLYLIHQAGGFNLLFVFKYFCLFLTLGILWLILRKQHFNEPFFPVLMLLIVSIGSYASMFLKPEILSLVFMAATAFLYFQAKLLLYKDKSYWLLFAFPLLFLVWINTHGVWMAGFIIFTIMMTGEVLNKYIGSKNDFDPILLKYISFSYLFTLPMLLINPYGFSYAVSPIYKIFRTIMPSAFSSTQDIGLNNILAYNNLFTTINDPTVNLILLWVAMLLIFVILYGYYIWAHKTWDWAVLLINIALCLLFALQLRSSYFWGPFWCLSLVFILKKPGAQSLFDRSKFKLIRKILVITVFLFFSILVIYKSIFFPFKDSWLGFGLNSWAPIDEVTFLKENRPGKRLYNSYKTGAYLMYALYPDFKVFIDARRFPYTGWLLDYTKFENGDTDLEKFNNKYPFDIALVDYSNYKVFIKLFDSKEGWQPIYYGSVAAVFVKKPFDTIYNLKNVALDRFDRLRNLKHADMVFTIAMNFDDMDAAEYILKRIRKKFKYCRSYQKVITDAGNKLDGLKAYQNKEYDTAYHLLSQSDDKTIVRVSQALIHLRVFKCRQLAAKKEYNQALKLIEKNLKQLPDHPDFLYTAGVMAYFCQSNSLENKKKFKQYLNKFIIMYPNHPHAKVARQILDNQKNLSIPLGL